ncbi:MAG: serine/threonine-protein kinase, partial [Thermoanaerobaculia bacterium]|nr:serine/threonine-protein kinase [Thermoanaerobaculia bacterium]
MTFDSTHRLGRYELLEELGRGAMGVVYLAQDPLIGRRVALKVFQLGFSASDEELHRLHARFIREAQSAGILSHPNIVTVHDVAPAEGEQPAFIAMEYVEGRTLKQILDAPEAIAWSDAIETVSQVAEGLDYAHSMGVVHRDVKPGNILVSDDGRIKITDFGIAQLNLGNTTDQGQLLGTPNYMAPEAIQEEEVDHRGDLFSLGVVLYELLTRQKPFAGQNMTQVTHRIVYEPFTPPSRIVEGLPRSLEAILERCLEKDPRSRFQTAGELLRALQEARPDVAPLPATASSERVDDSSTAPVDTRSVEVSVRKRSSRQPTRRVADSLRWLARPTPIGGVPVWLVAFGLLLGALGGYLLARSDLWAPPVARVEERATPVAIWRPLPTRVASLETTAAQRLAAGDLEGAESALFEAARLDPRSRRLADALERVAGQLRSEREQRRSRAGEHLAAARRSLADGRIRDAVEFSRRALAVDPMNLAAPDLIEAARREGERIAARREAIAEPMPTVSTPTVESEPEPQPVPRAEPEPPAPVPTTASLTVRLSAETSPGVLTVYAGEEQIVRERFRFVDDEEGGFLRSLTARPGAGTLELDFERQPAPHAFRVYVSMPGAPTQVLRLEED